jgi:hypothetical protein
MRSHYPVVVSDEKLWRALVYFAFGAVRDRKTKRLLASMRQIEWIWGRKIPHGRGSGGRPNTAEAVLKDIRARLLPGLTWRKHSKKDNRARTVITTGIDLEVQSAIDADLTLPVSALKDRVYVLDGRRFRKTGRTAARKEDCSQSAIHAATAPSPVTTYFLKRLNSDSDRPLRGFTALDGYAAAAIQAAQSYQVKSGDDDPCQNWKQATGVQKPSRRARTLQYRRSLLQTIRAIQDQPQPFYRSSSKGNTDRIFGLNSSILDLPSEVRHTMTDPLRWIELDLASAHLAIATALWKLPGIRSLLVSGSSVWDILIKGVSPVTKKGSRPHQQLKAILKAATYSAVFGMETPSLKRKITCEMNVAGFKIKGGTVLKLPVFAELISARTTVYAQIKAAGI